MGKSAGEGDFSAFLLAWLDCPRFCMDDLVTTNVQVISHPTFDMIKCFLNNPLTDSPIVPYLMK
jgi:hypothetical protein